MSPNIVNSEFLLGYLAEIESDSQNCLDLPMNTPLCQRVSSSNVPSPNFAVVDAILYDNLFVCAFLSGPARMHIKKKKNVNEA